MKTKLTKLFAVIALALFAVSCSDILTHAPKSEAQQGLLITVSDGDQKSRTLYPDATFTKYALDFENTDGTETYGPLTLTGEASKLISDLPAGKWKVTATGYVTIDGIEYAAAQGEGEVTVTSGSSQNLGITISASQEGDDGHFSYSVSFPEEMNVNYAYLRIEKFNGGSSQQFDLKNDPSGSVELSPGYYQMTVRLQNSYQTVGRMEAVHIYSNMETKADYNFTADDFTKLITLSGTLNVENTTPLPTSVSVYAYTNPDYTGNSVGGGGFNLSTSTWTMTIPAFDTDTTLYFQAYASFRNGNGGGSSEFGIREGTEISVTAKDGNIDNIALGSVTFPIITLSGTVTVEGAEPQNNRVSVRATDEGHTFWYEVQIDNYENNTWNGNTCTWAITMPAFDTETDVTVEAEIFASGQVRKSTSVTVKDADVSDIGITFALINLSGMVNFVMGDESLGYANIIAYTNSDYTGNAVGSAFFDRDSGTWTMTIPPFDTATTLYFQVYAYIYNYIGYARKGTGISRSVTDTDIDNIDLGTVTFNTITLSGTLTITVNGGTPSDYFSVYAYRDEDYTDRVEARREITDNAFTLTMLSFEEDTTLYFQLETRITNIDRMVRRGVGSVTVKDANVSGITLTAAITVSTVNGTVNIDNSCRIYALNGQISSRYDIWDYERGKVEGETQASGGVWSMTLPDTPDRWFAVEDYTTGNFYITKTAVDTSSGTVALDTADMDELDW